MTPPPSLSKPKPSKYKVLPEIAATTEAGPAAEEPKPHPLAKKLSNTDEHHALNIDLAHKAVDQHRLVVCCFVIFTRAFVSGNRNVRVCVGNPPPPHCSLDQVEKEKKARKSPAPLGDSPPRVKGM